MSAFTIRLMKDEDINAVVLVDAIAGILMPWSPHAYWGELRKNTSWCWAAESLTGAGLKYVMPFPVPIDDVIYLAGSLAVVGSVTLWDMAGDFHIANIAVHPEFSGLGIGRALMEMAIAKTKEQGAEKLLLEVRESNTRARRMYEKFGFVVDGRRKKYYSGNEDAILMSKVLNQLA